MAFGRAGEVKKKRAEEKKRKEKKGERKRGKGEKREKKEKEKLKTWEVPYNYSINIKKKYKIVNF